MKTNRRDFVKTLGAASIVAAIPAPSFGKMPAIILGGKNKIKFSFWPYDLQMKHTFTVAEFSRNTTPVILCKMEYGDFTGYGEASMPPYLGESQKTVATFLKKVNLEQFNNPFRMDDILDYVESVDNNNRAAKACIDIALHDLIGKIVNRPLYELWGLSPENTPNTSFTIGIDKPDIVISKTKEAIMAPQKFKILKVKLGRGNDKDMINSVRSVTRLPLYVDVNQGWKDKKQALDMIYWLKEQDVIFVEQPMPKENIDDMAWLTENSPLPTMADEAFQRLPDVACLKGVYSGINIKLMKSTGLREAYKMITVARALGMKVMVGCMVETSCAVSAAAQLSPLIDWADLDGNLLVKNDVYEGMKIIDGKVTLNELPGIGIKPLKMK